MRSRSTWGRAGACAVLLLTAACGSAGSPAPTRSSGTTQQPGSSASAAVAPATAPDLEDVSVNAPAKLTKPLLSSDILVFSRDPLPSSVVSAIGKVPGVTSTELFSMAQFFLDERQVTYAAVDPDSFRRYAPPVTAQSLDIWKRVAGGEMAMVPALASKLENKQGYVPLGNDKGAPEAHLGALAPLSNPINALKIDAVVNDRWTSVLKMQRHNALLVSLGSTSPQSIQKKLIALAGSHASVQILGPNFDTSVAQTAVLTGGSVSAAVGTFNYKANPDGTVAPDPSWVSSHIRTETMPIIGRVTGNIVMLPQLRGALDEVIRQGLTAKIYHYDGCYVPRFIAKDPSKGLSFHTFGTAIDLNAAANQRGTVGEMDRRVVQIFKMWGFDWGGDWHYTDPMHFELAHLAKTS